MKNLNFSGQYPATFQGYFLPRLGSSETALHQTHSHPQRVFTRSQLLERGWDDPDHRLERTIDSHIKSLRNKLRHINPDSDPICTHRGVGYSLIPDA